MVPRHMVNVSAAVDEKLRYVVVSESEKSISSLINKALIRYLREMPDPPPINEPKLPLR